MCLRHNLEQLLKVREDRGQCVKQPACLGLNTERPVHRTGPALFMPWSDAPGLSAHTLVVRSVGQEDGSPQWGVVHEHTRRPTPVFMNTFFFNSNFHRPTWACGGRPPAPKQHTPTPVDGAFDGRPLQHRESRFWASNPKFPFVHEQTTPAALRTDHTTAIPRRMIAPSA